MRKILLLPALLAIGLVSACSDAPEAPTTSGDNEAEVPAEPEAPAVAAFYVGTWAADPAWCGDQSEGFPIEIESERFLGRENICDMSEIADTPEGGWTARLTCQSEGMIDTERLSLAPVGEQLAITYPDRDDTATLFTRCD